MADLTLTAANVIKGANADIETGIAGEVITAGQPVYLDPATRKLLKADNDSGTAATRHARGIALNGAAANQPLAIQKGGDVTLGAVLTPGLAYYVSSTPGGICPADDLGSGDYVCQLGIAKSASVLALDIQFPNVAVPAE